MIISKEIEKWKIPIVINDSGKNGNSSDNQMKQIYNTNRLKNKLINIVRFMQAKDLQFFVRKHRRAKANHGAASNGMPNPYAQWQGFPKTSDSLSGHLDHMIQSPEGHRLSGHQSRAVRSPKD